jgi:hypothetical protein
MESLQFFVRINNHSSLSSRRLLYSPLLNIQSIFFHFFSVSLVDEGAGAAAAAVSAGGGGGAAGCEEEKNELKALKTVFCLFGSKVKRTTSAFGCSYGAVGSEREVATGELSDQPRC